MSKLTILMCLTCFSVSVFLSGCATANKNSGQMLHYKRKFEHLVKNEQQVKETKKTYGVIDLSDGQKVNYDTPFGPSFDIKY